MMSYSVEHSLTPRAGATALFVAIGGLQLAFFAAWTALTLHTVASGWSASASGALAATAWIAVACGLPVAPWLMRRLGARRLTHVALALTAAGGLALAAPAPVLWWVASVALGFGCGLRWVAVDAWLVHVSRVERLGRVLGIAEMVAGAAMFVAPLLVGLLVTDGLRPVGLLVVVLALAVCAALGFAPEPPATAGSSAASSRASAAATRGAGGFGPATALPLLGVALVAVAFVAGGFESGFMAVGALLAAERGALADAAMIATLVGIGSFAAQYLLAELADRIGAEVVLRACLMALTAGLLVVLAAPSLLPWMAVLIGAAAGGLYTLSILTGLRRAGAASASATISLVASSYTAGTAALPAVAGLLLDHSGSSTTLLVLASGAFLLTVAVRASR